MENISENHAPDEKAKELKQAFEVFNQVSLELTQAYEALQARVESLTAELAVANGKLLHQYQEKEALSERLSLLLNTLPAGVVVLNGESRVEEANPAAYEMLGGDLVGRLWSDVVETLLKASELPEEWHLASRRIAMAESPLDSGRGRLLLIHDVTVAHDLKAQAERNARLAAMGEMAASLAHQLRTPLATALLYSANLGAEEMSDAARKRFAAKASEQLRRLERLIQDVLLFARGESLGRDRMGVDELLFEAAQTVEPLCRARSVEFSVDVGDRRYALIGSRKALGGALLNLLENALQAVEGEEAAKIHLSASIAERFVSISVRDTGQGIHPELQKRIFEPFFTTRGQGTGLGLAIAQGVVRAHGGSIDLISLPGAGSEFIMRLPVMVANDEV